MDIEAYTKALSCLDGAKVDRLINYLNYPRDTLSNLTKTRLAVADWLAHLGIFSDAQIYKALTFVDPLLVQFSTTSEDEPALACTVVVCDGRWVSCSNADGFLDTDHFDELPEMPCPAVTHIVCDVTQLYNRMEERTRHIKSKEAPNAV